MSSFTVGIKVEGITDAMLRTSKAKEVASKAVAQALYIEGEKIMALSKGQYVPVLSGALRSSGHVRPPAPSAKWAYVVELGYGGPAVPYALVQHERHKTKAKYLERPALRQAPMIGRRVGAKVRVALATLGKKV